MRRTLWIVLGLALLASGCAISDFGIITDNNQTRAGGKGPNPVINTNGKAHLKMSSQIATIWPDGTDELFSFVDQKADGTATLTTYNNFSTFDEPPFHDDLYCNTDWTGCAIFTAPDDNDENLFDGRLNESCNGARSFSVLLSTGRYYGECGRRQAKFGIDDKIAVLNSAARARHFGRNGLRWNLDATNTKIRVRNLDTGATYPVPTIGARVGHFLAEHGNVAVSWLDHAMLAPALVNFSGMLENELNSEGLEVTVTYNGIDASFTIAGGANDLVRRHFRESSRRF